jgi:hypothetical protein
VILFNLILFIQIILGEKMKQQILFLTWFFIFPRQHIKQKNLLSTYDKHSYTESCTLWESQAEHHLSFRGGDRTRYLLGYGPTQTLYPVWLSDSLYANI